jgi:outer membrane protein OmpA-like peptidoglycan-associated protein
MKAKFLILILTLFTGGLFAQRKLADKFFEKYGYVKASELYEIAVKKGDSSEHVLTRLGDCYFNNSESKKAAFWYAIAANKYDKISSEYIFKYIQTLKGVGDYVEADKWMKKLVALKNKEGSTIEYDSSNLDKYNDLLSYDSKYIIEVENLPFNTELSDFGSYIRNNILFFASSESTSSRKLYNWNKEPFLDLFQVSVEEKGRSLKFGTPDFIKSSKINSGYHEASIAITNDGKTMYFTRDNVKRNKKLDYDKKGIAHLKIYKATLVGDSWEDIKELPFNGEMFSTGHPALSPDNKKLYFVSDREGGFGETDIYEVDILAGGQVYSEPRNLGPTINTSRRELFPFIAKDSTFYFSSEGFVNLGLLDIYKSNYLKDSNAQPENLGAPVNSSQDDFAFYIDPSNENNRSYFSSNRPGGKGSDDIYSSIFYECKQEVKGIARDKQTNELLSNVTVELISESGKIVSTITTDKNGEYSFEIDCQKQYSLRASKSGYESDVQSFATSAIDGEKHTVDLFLKNLLAVPCEIVINPIFFDFDKWNIRTDSQYDLENIVDIMRAYPNIKITIESHTDRRGTLKYNDKLSDRRAKSTRDYIISRGIGSERIVSAIGYGERRTLIGEQEIDAMPTREEKEAAHQKNRRSHFRIVDCDEN